jgi:hypothetical protein
MSLIVGTQGWSGGGFFVQNSDVLDKLVDVTTHPADYYLHLVIRSRNQTVYLIGMDGQSNAKIAIGSAGFNDNGVITPAVADFTRDGEWHELEIPMTTFTTGGLLYSTGLTGKNVMWFLAGGVSGATMDLDAVFIYKK